jgi:hypothetical protein
VFSDSENGGRNRDTERIENEIMRRRRRRRRREGGGVGEEEE